MKRAFTLIEVNLAMLIMAGAVLSLVGLYSLGFRENKQSREDVAATAMADGVVNALVVALSATNVTWSSFKNLANYPSDNGWRDYMTANGTVRQDPAAKAQSTFRSVMGALQFDGSANVNKEFPSTAVDGTDMSPALVVMHQRDSAVVRIAFRAVKTDKPGTLLSMPLFFTEVHFQGRPDL